jgi:hypothetical protein
MTRTRPLAAAATAACILLLPAAPALAATTATSSSTAVTATSQGALAGHSKVFQGQNAGIEKLTVEGSSVIEGLCVQFGVPSDRTSPLTAITREQGNIKDVGKAAWIGANHTKVGTPLSDPNFEATATQLAAWSYTDSLSYTAENLPNATIRNRAAELRAAAASKELKGGHATYTLAVEVERDGPALVATATLTGDNGAPISGDDISFTVAGSADGQVSTTTDALGKATVTAEDAIGEGTVTAVWSGKLKAGTLLSPADDGQIMVTTEDAAITRTVEVAFAAATPIEEPTTEEPTTEEPTTEEPTTEEPTTEDPAKEAETGPASREELPYTGPGTILLPLAALGSGGAGYYGWRLRRRSMN